MAVQQPSSSQKESSVGNRAELRACSEIATDPGERLFGNDMVRIAARIQDNSVDHGGCAHAEVWLNIETIGGAYPFARQSHGDPAIAGPAGERVCCAQRLDDRAEGHHRKARKDQDRECDGLTRLLSRRERGLDFCVGLDHLITTARVPLRPPDFSSATMAGQPVPIQRLSAQAGMHHGSEPGHRDFLGNVAAGPVA